MSKVSLHVKPLIPVNPDMSKKRKKALALFIPDAISERKALKDQKIQQIQGHLEYLRRESLVDIIETNLHLSEDAALFIVASKVGFRHLMLLKRVLNHVHSCLKRKEKNGFSSRENIVSKIMTKLCHDEDLFREESTHVYINIIERYCASCVATSDEI